MLLFFLGGQSGLRSDVELRPMAAVVKKLGHNNNIVLQVYTDCIKKTYSVLKWSNRPRAGQVC